MTSAKSIETAIIHKDRYGEWDQFAKSASGGSAYAASSYLDILCGVTNARFQILGVYNAGDLIGGIALYQSKSRYGFVASPRLLLYYHSIVLAQNLGSSTQLAVLEALAAALGKLGLARVTLNNRSDIKDIRTFAAAGWSSSITYSYVVPLSKQEPAATHFDKNLRRLIRRAEEAGVTVTEDSDFESFFRLHSEIHERKGAPLYLEKSAFNKYINRIISEKLGRLFHARLPDGSASATQLVLTGGHPVTHTVCAGSAREGLALGVTPLLRARVFDILAQEGATANDLTDAALNPISQFKSHLGANLVPNFMVDKVFSLALRARLAVKQVVNG